MKFPKFLKDRGITTILGIDFETYFSKDYSLAKKGTSTTEYVRDERFKTQCVGLQTHRQKKAETFHDAWIERAFDSLDWSKTAILAHHAHFDGLILTHQYKVTPAFYFCTLSMARPIHGGSIRNDLDTVARFYRLGNKLPDILDKTKGIRDLPPDLLKQLMAYNKQDVEIMWKVFERLLKEYTVDELLLIHHTIRAYTEPVLKVNQTLAHKEHRAELSRREKVVKSTGLDEKSLRSREKFATALRDVGVSPPMKISATTGHPTYAFAKNDIDFVVLKSHPEQEVRDLIEAREICASSIGATRALRLISHSGKNALPIYLKYGGAHTLRWSGGDLMNPQNFQRGSPLRTAIQAPPGHKLIIFDSGQIEARVNAWLAGQLDLIEQFRLKDAGDETKDPYKIFAGDIFKEPYETVSSQQRFVGKTCILGLGYQMAGNKLWWTLVSGSQGPPLQVEEGTCHGWVHRYRSKYEQIVKQWTFMQKIALPIMFGKGPEKYEYGPIIFVEGGYWSSNNIAMKYPFLRPTIINEVKKVKAPFGEKHKAPPSDDLVLDKYDGWVYNEASKIYGGLLTENVVQNLARNVVAEQILSVADDYRLVLQVHDEGVFCVPNAQTDEAYERIDKAFRTSPDWAQDLPVIGEGIISKVYAKP